MSRSIAALIDIVRSESAGALPQERSTSRKILYWGATGLVATVTLLAAFSYLTTAPQAVENFRHVGYHSSCVSCSASQNCREPSCCCCHGCRR